MSKIKIALDAGHGINTAGKRTPDGEREWTFNNKVAKYCDERLKQYGKFETIRVDDVTGKTDVPLPTRTNKAEKWGADIYTSIHQNANTSKWGNWGGTETFCNLKNSKGKRLAELVQTELVKNLGLRNRGVKDGNHLHVIRATSMIAILTEGAFMDSLTDISSLREESKLKLQGYAIADGIAKFYGFELNGKSPATSTNKGDEDELKFSSPTLKESLNKRLESPSSEKLIIENAVKELGYDKSWLTKDVTDGDILAMTYELAIKLIKEKK